MRYCFILVGAGGIGGNVARDLPKLLVKQDHKMIVIDGDTVEEKNCVRQPFQTQDVGQNKARVLARKINSFYNIDCEARDFYITDKELDVIVAHCSDYVPVFIGCVDNDKTRKLIEKAYIEYKGSAVYIDGANSEFDGNIYISRKDSDNKYGPIRSDVYKLDDDINPGLVGCEIKASKGEMQYLITNNKIAAWIIDVVYDIIRNGHYNLKTGVIVIERFNVLFK